VLGSRRDPLHPELAEARDPHLAGGEKWWLTSQIWQIKLRKDVPKLAGQSWPRFD